MGVNLDKHYVWAVVNAGFTIYECYKAYKAGTKVLTEDGEKNIEDIEVGDMVLAKSEFDVNGELAYKEVTALYTNYRNDLIKLYIKIYSLKRQTTIRSGLKAEARCLRMNLRQETSFRSQMEVI